MLKGWYYNRKNGQRLLSLAEIAQGCGCTAAEVDLWFCGKTLNRGESGEKFIDAGEVVAFLVSKSMPVPTELLPPYTLKLLFITGETDSSNFQQEQIEAVLSFFRHKGNILVDNASPGKFADLTILTFAPDIVVYILPDAGSLNTLTLLSSFPECRAILVVTDDQRQSIEKSLSPPSPHIIVSDKQTAAGLAGLLGASFA